MGGVDELIASRELLLSPEILEQAAHEGALGVPEREPRPHGVFEREELELTPELAVVLEHGFLPERKGFGIADQGSRFPL